MHKAALQGTSALNALSSDSANALTRGRGNGSRKGRWPFVRQIGTSDPFDLFIAPPNIYEKLSDSGNST